MQPFAASPFVLCCALFLIGCGGFDSVNAPNIPCDVPTAADRGTDVPITPTAPYTLSVRVYPPSEHRDVQSVRVVRLAPYGGPDTTRNAYPERPLMIGGEYRSVGVLLTNIDEEAVTVAVEWTFVYNELGHTATTGLIDQDPETYVYRHRGHVEVTDQYDRVWVGYPVTILGRMGMYLRFVPGPCADDYAMRRDNLCVR